MHEPLPRRSAAANFAQQHFLHRDYETRSRAILKNVGTHRYAGDPSTEIQCVAFAVDDGPVQLWLPGNPLPPEFLHAALDPTWIVVAHGDHFETAIEQHVLAPQFGWPLIPIERHRCTMAMSLAAGLPARLSAAADALELGNRKDDAGERLMHQMSKPRRARQAEDPASYIGLMIRSDLIASTLFAGKTSGWNASYLIGCRHYHHKSNCCGG